MINYNPHHWRDHLFDIQGSMIREIFDRVAMVTAWSGLVVVFDRMVRHIDMTTAVHALVGFALSTLLVFRTNSSYDRFWEGRRQWGTIVNASRNLARSTSVLFSEAPELHRDVVHWLIAFAHALRNNLRGQPGLGSAIERLREDDAREVSAATHVPLAAAIRITDTLNLARRTSVVSDLIFRDMDANVGVLVDAMGACERIHSTPMPFVYMVHIRRALILYTGTLPLALVSSLGWWTVPCNFIVAYFLFGIEEIGVEIEDPFGSDSNDLPLERICETLERTLLGIEMSQS